MTGCEECDGQHWCPYCEDRIEAEHARQDALTASLGQVTCFADHNSSPCPFCGAAV